jgi:hypothetical protein
MGLNAFQRASPKVFCLIKILLGEPIDVIPVRARMIEFNVLSAAKSLVKGKDFI